MVLGIDIDDTITYTSRNASKYLKKFAPNFQKDYHELSQEKYYEFLRKYIIDIMKSNPLKENVKECLDYLHEKGHRIIFITARNNVFSPDVEKTTMEYLKKHEIYYDEVIFDEEDTDKKGEIALKHHVDLFIDDREDVLDEVSSFGIPCIRVTNKESKYPTFTDWKSIVKYIERK